MRLLLTLIFIICLSLASTLYAQDAKTLRSLGNAFYKVEKYNEALENYLQYQKLEPKDEDIKFKIGNSYFKLKNFDEAEKYFTFLVTSNSGRPREAYLILGQIAQERHNFQEAINFYKQYLILTDSNNTNRSLVKKYIKQCASGLNLSSKEELAFVETMTGNVNSTGDDLAPVFSPTRSSTFYYASVREGNSGGLRDGEGYIDDFLGKYTSDMYAASMNNGSWINQGVFNDFLSSPAHEGVVGFSENGQVLYYYKGQSPYYGGAIYTDTFSTEEKVVIPNELKSTMNPRGGDATPFIFKDSIFVFASKREGGQGGFDLYVTMRLNGSFWTLPQNISKAINSPYDEICPFLANDGRTLYFSSNGTNSMGGFDIFVSKYNDATKTWSLPENLGMPINSGADELYFTIEDEGYQSFICSNRQGSKGGFDIYSAYFKNQVLAQTTQSNPVAFLMIEQGMASTPSVSEPIVQPDPELRDPITTQPIATSATYTIGTIYYEGDDVLTNEAKKALEDVSKIAFEYPTAKFVVTAYGDLSDPSQFAHYLTFRRGVSIGDYLKEQGVLADNITIKGVAAQYPVATGNQDDGSPNKVGRRYNRRIEVEVLGINDDKITIEYKNEPISKFMVSAKGVNYKRNIKGLSYKVQVAAMATMYKGDLLNTYNDGMVERKNNESIMKYTVGLFRSYGDAQKLANVLQNKGIDGVFVVPYIDGIRASKEDLKIYASDYPDIKNFMKEND